MIAITKTIPKNSQGSVDLDREEEVSVAPRSLTEKGYASGYNFVDRLRELPEICSH